MNNCYVQLLAPLCVFQPLTVRCLLKALWNCQLYVIFVAERCHCHWHCTSKTWMGSARSRKLLAFFPCCNYIYSTPQQPLQGLQEPIVWWFLLLQCIPTSIATHPDAVGIGSYRGGKYNVQQCQASVKEATSAVIHKIAWMSFKDDLSTLSVNLRPHPTWSFGFWINLCAT